ncbi:MAG TPA: D-2-hydroxyacid dehydrogenase family protein [Geminicoccaceae bacterium]|nr:D-2-hydroxyacid dehydrogenase family protein [Geminicoccus sp.]HMU48348.1 D-2-hydroxyacid dehydrogenase family protein [Geminicoccaceae bacterium]
MAGRACKVAVLDDYQHVAERCADWSRLRPEAEVDFFHDHLSEPGEVVARLAPFDVVCAMRERTPFDAAMLATLPALKLLVTTGAANASIDMEAAEECGVTVCGTGGVASATPELTWALILAALRHLPEETASVRRGGWQEHVGIGLAGKTLGVIGLGRIGTAVARVGRAFGMHVIAWSQNLTAGRAAEQGVERVEKAALLARADIVTIHLKLSERTRGLLGAAELALMKPSAWLVNTSRGPIVDEAALIEALQARRIAGAALDVFDVEPLPPGHPFRSLDNVVASPHIGYVTEETYRVFHGQTVENVRAWIDGAPVRVIGRPDTWP